MPYHRLAHLDSFEAGIKKNIRVKRGDVIGRVGNTGASTGPHTHWDIFKERPDSFTEYVWGLSKAQVKARYINPEQYADKQNEIPMKWSHYSNGWLTPISNGRKKGYHSGLDLNFGSGWDDYRFELRAPVDGIVVHTQGEETSKGWGNFIVIKEKEGMDYDNHLIQETEDSGSFALVYGGEKHLVTAERAGFAALTVLARDMKFETVSKAQWDATPSGEDF